MSFLMSFQKRLMEDDFLDDGIDNIHRQFMPVLLLIIDVFLGIKQFVGDPIECYVPNGLSGNGTASVAGRGCWRCRTWSLALPDAFVGAAGYVCRLRRMRPLALPDTFVGAYG